MFAYLIAKVIGFLAMYHDWILCAIYHNRETICGQKHLFLSVMLLHFYCFILQTFIISCPSINKLVDNW